MVEIVAKKGSQLSKTELQEITEIAQNANPAFPNDYLQEFHIKRYNPEFYMHKIDEKVVAVQAFFHKKLPTPFHQKPLDVVFVSVVFKDVKADKDIKNFAKKGNLLFLKRNIGKLWFLQKFLFIFQTYNPKAVERISPTFYEVYPKVDIPVSEKVYAFVRNFINKYLKSNEIELSNYLIRKNKFENPVPITNEWESSYKSKSETLNQFFIDHEIIKQEDNSYFLEGRAIFFVGYYNFWEKLRQKFSFD